jgi:hypothetical protein
LLDIQCNTIEEAERALATVREMVLNGEADEQLAKESKDARVRFKAG